MKRELQILVVLLILDLIGVALLWFAYSTIDTKEAERAQLVSELAEEKQKASQAGSLQKTVKQAEKEHGVLAKYFYDQGEESQIKFVSQIEGLGTSTSHALVETRSFDLSAGGSPRFHGEFAVSGTWTEVYHFLRLIEVFPARIIINRFTAASAVSTANGVTKEVWNGSISIDVMSLKNK